MTAFFSASTPPAPGSTPPGTVIFIEVGVAGVAGVRGPVVSNGWSMSKSSIDVVYLIVTAIGAATTTPARLLPPGSAPDVSGGKISTINSSANSLGGHSIPSSAVNSITPSSGAPPEPTETRPTVSLPSAFVV